MRELVTYSNAVGLLSILAATAAIYLAVTDKKAAAGTMGGLFLAMAIVSQLDSFKSFKAFAVEAQLQDKIDRADELIKQLRELSILVAKSGYSTAGLSILSPNSIITNEVALTKDFDNLLTKLKLSESELQDARRPLLRVVGLKLAVPMSNVGSAMMTLKENKAPRSENFQLSPFFLHSGVGAAADI